MLGLSNRLQDIPSCCGCIGFDICSSQSSNVQVCADHKQPSRLRLRVLGQFISAHRHTADGLARGGYGKHLSDLNFRSKMLTCLQRSVVIRKTGLPQLSTDSRELESFPAARYSVCLAAMQSSGIRSKSAVRHAELFWVSQWLALRKGKPWRSWGWWRPCQTRTDATAHVSASGFRAFRV